MTLGKTLKKLRSQKDLSQYEVAEKLGIKRGRYNSWENDIAKPRFEMLNAICEFYNISMNELTDSDDESGNKTREENGTYQVNNEEKKDTPDTIKTWLRNGNPDLTEKEKDKLAEELEDYFTMRKKRIIKERSENKGD